MEKGEGGGEVDVVRVDSSGVLKNGPDG
jgi:hypothetical protein